ncbi:multivesicular body subunit 12B [Planococcus citri]|uniref:multivesicular body subunit 12B n=1 Tax=Planococcus citri TaxID=170843 RepID=UPI0031F8EEDD
MLKQNPPLFSDDKPITAVCVIEDAVKCPKGFKAITKSYDADQPADLGKDTSFFAKKATRYLCISKTESIADYVLEDLRIINEKDLPPEGYGLIPRTMDSDQRSWRKKQLCYKLSRKNLCPKFVVDIVILVNKTKGTPLGFELVGELNGFLICVKLQSTAPVATNHIGSSSVGVTNGYPKLNGNVANVNGLMSKCDISGSKQNDNHDYENLIIKPTRPAPSIPNSNSANQCASNAFCQGLQGVPFVLNTRLEFSSKSLLDSLPSITIKTKEDIDKEYFYDFKAEKELCMF